MSKCTVCWYAGQPFRTKKELEEARVRDRAYTRRLTALAAELDKGPRRSGHTANYFGCASMSDAALKVRALLAVRALKGIE